MRIARLGCVLLAASVVGLAVPAMGRAATCEPARWIDTTAHFSIVLPCDWYAIPRTKALLQKAVSTYKAAGDTSLAGAYTTILDSSLAMSELPQYAFQAFLWPPLETVVPTEVDVQLIAKKGVHFTASNLPQAASEYAESLAGSGTTMSKPVALKLHGGLAEYFQATFSEGNGVSTGVDFYMLVYGGRFYVLSLSIEEKLLAKATIFRAIADDFSFSVAA